MVYISTIQLETYRLTDRNLIENTVTWYMVTKTSSKGVNQITPLWPHKKNSVHIVPKMA